MIKLSKVIREVVEQNSFLKLGLSHKLLNLSQVAEFILPVVEAKAKKEVTKTSILMTLSRMQRDLQLTTPSSDKFRIQNLTVNSNLSCLTFYRTEKNMDNLEHAMVKVSREGGYITVTHGTSEMTLIVDNDSIEIVERHMKEEPVSKIENLVSLAVHFDENYSTTPGFIYHIVQQLTLQHINIVEISSTYTELILYVDKADVRLAFDTLYRATYASSSDLF